MLNLESGLEEQRKGQRHTPYSLTNREGQSKEAEKLHSVKAMDLSLLRSDSLCPISSASNSITNYREAPLMVTPMLSPLVLEYLSSSSLSNFDVSWQILNGRKPGYSLRPSKGMEKGLSNHKSIPASFICKVKFWMFHTMPNLDSLMKAKVKGHPLHSLLLEYEYLLITEMIAAIIKGWSNVIHQNILSISNLIHHCLAHNIPIQLVVPALMLTVF